MIRRILVLRGGALGDFLVTLPALGLLRTNWPAARIELVGHARAAGLAVLGGYLDAAHSQHEARWSALFAPAPLPSGLADWLGTFDVIINYWPDPDRILAGRFPVRCGQTYVAGTAVPTIAPAARHFCEPLRSLGLATDDFQSRLPYSAKPSGNERPDVCEPDASRTPLRTTPSAAPSSGRDSRQAPVAIHPGSGSAAKNWPDDRWRELMARLDAPVLLVLGEAERERWNAQDLTLLPSPHGQRREVADCLPLPALAAALRQCRLFLGHDSGLSHLAAAVGRPCVLLFGPTDPAMWAPPGPRVRVIRRGATPDCISVEEVLEALGGLRIRS
jgi:heptosyltransferase-2